MDMLKGLCQNQNLQMRNPNTFKCVSIFIHMNIMTTEKINYNNIANIDDNMTITEYKEHLSDFYNFLKSDWKRWCVMQIKQSMINGNNDIFLTCFKRSKWERRFNITKKIPLNELKYFNKKKHVFIIDKWLRNIIDFVTEIGLEWYPNCTVEEDGNFAKKYNELWVSWKWKNLRQRTNVI